MLFSERGRQDFRQIMLDLLSDESTGTALFLSVCLESVTPVCSDSVHCVGCRFTKSWITPAT